VPTLGIGGVKCGLVTAIIKVLDVHLFAARLT